MLKRRQNFNIQSKSKFLKQQKLSEITKMHKKSEWNVSNGEKNAVLWNYCLLHINKVIWMHLCTIVWTGVVSRHIFIHLHFACQKISQNIV